MTTDTPRRSIQAGHLYSDRARQALSFPSGVASKRTKTSSAATSKAAYCIVFLLVLLLAGFSVSRGRRSSHFPSNDAIRKVGQPALNLLRNCTAASTSPVCKWARKHNRANRKRPVDWEPKEGWPEDVEVLSSTRHTSDRALTAVEKALLSLNMPSQPLQSVAQSFWPTQSAPWASETQRSNLPQCAALHSHPCIAVIGSGNFSYELQPELHNCTTVQELQLVTAANCQHSAGVWMARQPQALSELTALTSNNHQCSMEQLLSKTAAMWYLGGEAAHIQQLQTQDIRIAGVPAVHFADAVWHERYKVRPSAAVTSDAMQPSALWIGLITVLECASASQQIHVFTSQSSSTLHDVTAEADLLEKLHASGIITLHQDCLAGIPCTASQNGVILQGEKGLVAPGVKLYPHRKKWQDASMRVYNEEEDDEDEDNV
ncbi:hypothetical protein ABBQ32_001126 [Trebouxia sp. C0010 RCD-2024]